MAGASSSRSPRTTSPSFAAARIAAVAAAIAAAAAGREIPAGVGVLSENTVGGGVASAFSLPPAGLVSSPFRVSRGAPSQPRTSYLAASPPPSKFGFAGGGVRLWSTTAGGASSYSAASSSSPSDDNRPRPSDDEEGEEFDHHGSPDHREYVLDLTHYRTTSEFNSELEVLARRCVDDVPGAKEDVIGCAALAEEMLRKWEDKVREAERVADDAEDEAGEGGVAESIREEIVRPDLTSYNTVIRAWSKACSTLAEGRGRGTIRNTIGTDMSDLNVYSARDAASRAQDVLNDLEGRYLDGSIDVAPVASSYNSVIDAWAKSRCGDAAERAESVLDRMKHLSDGKEEQSTSSDSGPSRVNARRSNWERASPDIVSYNSVMEAWAHSADPDALRKARNALEMLQVKYEKTGDSRIKPNIRTVNQVINCYAKRGAYEDIDGDEAGGGGAGGEGGSDNNAERAWSAARRAERLLNDMTSKYSSTGDPDYKPDATTYTSVIDAYAKVGDAAASERAESLLNRVERMYNETGDADIKPNYRTYTAVIGGWANTRKDDGAPHRAEEILRRMEALHAESVKKGERIGGREGSVKPNSRTYTSVINAWARSRDPRRHKRSLLILKKMLDLQRNGDESARPSLYTYNAVMESCSKCRGTGEEQVEALKIAFAANKALGQQQRGKSKSEKGSGGGNRGGGGIEANHVTYSILLKCAHKLLPAGEERNRVVRAVFEKAREAGQVDPSVMRQLQMAADRNVFYELCESIADLRGRVDFNDLPHEWRRNVRR